MKTPKRPKSHVTGDIGHTYSALLIKQWGWTADRIESDYGEDLDCSIFIDGYRTKLTFRCQVKSTLAGSSSVRKLKCGYYSVSISTRLAKAWLLSYCPVLLIVYDEQLNTAFWANASEQLRSKVSQLDQKSITLKVSPHSILESSQAELTSSVQRFYSGFLRLTSATLACEMYPVLMPHHFSFPIWQFKRSSQKELPDLETEYTSLALETAPSWLTVISTLEFGRLSGWQINGAEDNLDQFFQALEAFMEQTIFEITRDEWITFVISPIRFIAENSDNNGDFWNRELTGWMSFSKICNRIVNDMDYAFEPPNGFLRQIARRATSWEEYHFVNPEIDLAMQLFASTATTPSYKATEVNYRQHILGQFIPWICDETELETMDQLLGSAGLTFRVIEDFSPQVGKVCGIIRSVFFEPNVGLFALTENWDKFTGGTVKKCLVDLGLFKKLPGKEGDSEISDLILDMFSKREEPPDRVLTTQRHYISGLPIDHSRRIVQVERYRSIRNADEDIIGVFLEECKEELQNNVEGCEEVEASSLVLCDYTTEKVLGLSVSWQPELCQSSKESFHKACPILLKYFDTIFSFIETNVDGMKNTMEVLKYIGSLHFEGEERWKGYRKEKPANND